MTRVLCPGSFDPITNGHLDVIERIAPQFDEVIVAVLLNPNKHGMFTLDERLEMITEATAHLPNVAPAEFSGLLIDFARERGATAIVKGLRGAGDFEYELPMAQMNRRLSGIETFFVASSPETSYLSSSLIKEVAKLGGDISGMLAPGVEARLRAKLAEG